MITLKNPLEAGDQAVHAGCHRGHQKRGVFTAAPRALTTSPGEEVSKGTRACQIDLLERGIHRIVHSFPWPRPQLMIEILSVGNCNPQGLARRLEAQAEEDRAAGKASRWPTKGPFSEVPGTAIPDLAVTQPVFVAIEDLYGISRGSLVIIALLEILIPLLGKCQKLLLALSCQARDLRRRLTPVQQHVRF